MHTLTGRGRRLGPNERVPLVPFVRTKDGLLIPKNASSILFLPELSAKVIRRRNGRVVDVEDLGVLSRRVVTTAGVNFLASAFINTVEPEVLNQHGSGTGTTAEAVGDTALVTEVESRSAGTQSNPSANVYRTVATIAYTATRAVTEHGVFSAASAGTLWDRSVFSAVNVLNGDSIQFTYNLTITSGG